MASPTSVISSSCEPSRSITLYYAFGILWDEYTCSDDEVETLTFRNGEDVRYPAADRPCLNEVNVPCTAITSMEMAKGFSVWRVRTTTKSEKRKSDPYLPDYATCAEGSESKL